MKERAVRVVEAVAGWPRGEAGVRAAQERLTAMEAPPRLAAQAAPVLGDEPEATARVIAAQYGGLVDGRASVLVAYRQWVRRADGAVTPGGSTFDVRLEEGRDGWEVSALHPARPGRAKRDPGGLAERVLAHDRIRLPPAAAADVRAGTLRPYPLRALLALAEDYEIDVSIVHSGHPRNVFGTARLSDHTRMRAFDVWAVDGRRVIDPGTPDRLIDGFLRRAVAAGAYNVGGPRQLSGGSYFTDRVHRDHLHIAFNRDD